MTTKRCLIRALLMMSAICAVCSRVPDRLGVEPFCMPCSIKLLDARKEYIAFRRQDVNTFNGIDSSVMGRKFVGSSVLPFLCINIVQAFFHSFGTVPDSQTS
jgi:hypothetical protein